MVIQQCQLWSFWFMLFVFLNVYMFILIKKKCLYVHVLFVLSASWWCYQIPDRFLHVSCLCDQVCNFLVGLFFLDLVEKFGVAPVYASFGGFSLLAAIFAKYFIVETTGRSLEEIEMSLNPNFQARDNWTTFRHENYKAKHDMQLTAVTVLLGRSLVFCDENFQLVILDVEVFKTACKQFLFSASSFTCLNIR